MYGVNNISPSVNALLTPRQTSLGAPGDMYIITDTRQRSKKDLDEIKSLQRFQIEKFDADKSLNLEKNLGKSENEKRFDAELDRLKKEWADAENTFTRKLGEFKARQKKDSSITNDQILKAVQPYKDAAILAKGAYLSFRDKRSEYLRADENQMSLFGLGKPTIKLEFENNSDLADFLKSNPGASSKFSDFADYEDVTATASPASAKTSRPSVRRNILIPGATSQYLPEAAAPTALPPSPTSPKALPPSSKQPTPGLPSFDKVFKNPDGIYFNERRIGDYGTINDNLRYINLYIDKNYGIARNIFIYAEKIFPNAVVIVCFVKDGKWKFYLERKKYQDAVRKYLPKFYVNGVSKYIVIDDIPSVERLVKAFENDGKNVVLIYRNIVDDINDVPSTHAALPPSPTSPTPPSNPNSFDAPDWDAIWKRMSDSYYWSSFDPESAANFSVKEFKKYYDYALDRLPEDRKKDFTDKFVSYIYEIARLNAAAPSAAVTGRGGISARQAARYNAANDRYMEKRAKFTDWIQAYIDRAVKKEEREAKAAMSSEDKFDARFEEIKKNIDYLAKLLQYRGQVPSYSITNARQNLQSKIENEASKGNVELVERLLEYMKPLNIYTNRSSIWTLADRAKQRVARNHAQEARFEQQNEDETAGYKVEFDTNEDRVKIYFDSIPSENIRTWLKKRGFRWSPRNSAWQRQITVDSRYAINDFNRLMQDGTLSGLGKPTIKLEFEDNDELMRLFDTADISGMSVNDKPADVFNCPESLLQCRGFVPTYVRLASYDHLITPANGQKTLVGYGFEKATIDELINACRNYKQVERLAKHLKGDTPLQSAFNIWHFLHTNVRYDYDAPGEEEIRTPARCWADRAKGVDCDCLAVMTACLLINMGYRPRFEIVGFGKDKKFSHIYVNLDGAAIDRVLPVFLQRPDGITITKIMDIPVYQLSGCNVRQAQILSGVYANTLSKILTHTATGDDSVNFRKTQVLITLQGCDAQAFGLGAAVMPYVAAIGDDGAYYFSNAEIAKIASQADGELRQMQPDADFDKWLQNVIVKIKNAQSSAGSVDSALTAASPDRTQIVVIINPVADAVNVEGDMVKADMIKCNALIAAMLQNLKSLIAVNFRGMASRFAVGLMSQEKAAQYGYGLTAWQNAVAAIAKLKELYKTLSGSYDDVIAAVLNGAQKTAILDGMFNDNQMLVAISESDAELSGTALGVPGINGLGGAVTIRSAIDGMGEWYTIVWDWIRDVNPDLDSQIFATSLPAVMTVTETPTASAMTAASGDNAENAENAENKDDWFWLLVGGIGVFGAITAMSDTRK